MGKRDSLPHTDIHNENKLKKKTPTFNQILLKSANISKTQILQEDLQSISNDLLARFSQSNKLLDSPKKSVTESQGISDSSDSTNAKLQKSILKNAMKIKKEIRTPVQSSKEDSSSSSGDELTMPAPIQIKKEKGVLKEASSESSDDEPEMPNPIKIKTEALSTSDDSDSEPEMPLPMQIKEENLSKYPIKKQQFSSSESESEPEVPLPIQIKQEPAEVKVQKQKVKKVISNVPSPLIKKELISKSSHKSSNKSSPEENTLIQEPKSSSSSEENNRTPSKFSQGIKSKKRNRNKITVSVPTAIKNDDSLSSEEININEKEKTVQGILEPVVKSEINVKESSSGDNNSHLSSQDHNNSSDYQKKPNRISLENKDSDEIAKPFNQGIDKVSVGTKEPYYVNDKNKIGQSIHQSFAKSKNRDEESSSEDGGSQGHIKSSHLRQSGKSKTDRIKKFATIVRNDLSNEGSVSSGSQNNSQKQTGFLNLQQMSKDKSSLKSKQRKISTVSDNLEILEKNKIVQDILQMVDLENNVKQKKRSTKLATIPQTSSKNVDYNENCNEEPQTEKQNKKIGKDSKVSVKVPRPNIDIKNEPARNVDVSSKNGKKRKLSSSLNEVIENDDEKGVNCRTNSDSDRTSQDSGLFSDEQAKVKVLQQVIFTPRKPKTWQEKVQQHFPLVRKIEIETDIIDSDIDKSDCDVHLLRIPRIVDPKLLQKLKLNLDKETLFTLCGTNDEYAIKPTETKCNPVLIISDKPRLINFKSVLKMNKYAKNKKIREVTVPEKCAVLFPEDLKVRHPLFGADFEPKIKLDEDTEHRLREVTIKLASKQKHKKKKVPKEESEIDSQGNEMIFTLLNSHSSNKISKRKEKPEKLNNDLQTNEIETDTESDSKKKKRSRRDMADRSLDMAKTYLYPELDSELDQYPQKKTKNEYIVDNGTVGTSKSKKKHKLGGNSKHNQVVNSTLMSNSSIFPSFSADVSSIIHPEDTMRKSEKSNKKSVDNLMLSISDELGSELNKKKKKKKHCDH